MRLPRLRRAGIERPSPSPSSADEIDSSCESDASLSLDDIGILSPRFEIDDAPPAPSYIARGHAQEGVWTRTMCEV